MVPVGNATTVEELDMVKTNGWRLGRRVAVDGKDYGGIDGRKHNRIGRRETRNGMFDRIGVAYAEGFTQRPIKLLVCLIQI